MSRELGADTPEHDQDSDPAPVEDAMDVRFRLFAAIWACANLLHLVNIGGQGFQNPAGWINALAAIYLLFDPGSVRRLALLGAAQIAEFAWTSPFSADHQALAAAANLAILLTLLGHAVVSRKGLPSRTEFGRRVFPALRVILLIAYTAAAVAKYNSTFLDPVTSCASFLADASTFGFLGGGGLLGRVHVLAAIGPETLVPLLLLIPLTRRFGVRFAIFFHMLIALSPQLVVGDFSLVLTALFLLYASDDDAVGLMTKLRARLHDDVIGRRLRSFRSPLATSLVLTAVLGMIALSLGGRSTALVWVASVAILPRIFVGLLSTPLAWRSMGASMGRISPVQGVVCLLLLGWVLSPYVGLRTTGVFTMFSNLRTEGEGTNHLFMPSVHIVDYQNDVVVPGAGSSEEFDALMDAGYGLTTIELRRELEADAELAVTGARNGQPITEGDQDDFDDPLPTWLRKIFQFRIVPAGGDPLCLN